MAKSMPGIIIKIGANTKGAIDGLNKVNRAVGTSATGADRFRASWRKIGPDLAKAAAGVGALAVAMGTVAVKAAMEEEQSVARLSTTLQNLGLAYADTGVEKFIDNMQYQSTFADQDLRPAMDRLLRSTGNVQEAQRALGIAADIAYAKQRPIVDVANILGKAYDGNTMSLGRLGVGLDKVTLKSGDMNEIMLELSSLFGGQAAAGADTLAGKLQILSNATGELTESFGQGILSGFLGQDWQKGGQSLDDAIAQMRKMQEESDSLGRVLGQLGQWTLQAFDNIRVSVTSYVYGMQVAVNGLYNTYINVADALNMLSDEEAAHEREVQRQIMADQQLAYNEDILGYKFGSTTGAINTQTTALAGIGKQAEATGGAIDQLGRKLDKFDARRNVTRQRIQLARTRAGGPDATGGKKGNIVTEQDARLWGLDVADQASGIAQTLFDSGKRGKGRQVLADARSFLRRSLGQYGIDADSFVGKYLPSRASMTPLSAPQAVGQRVPGYTSASGGTVINYNGPVTIVANTDAELVKQATLAARRRGLGTGRGPTDLGGRPVAAGAA